MKECKTSNGLIRYQVYGQGTPVMLVHGFGESGSVWNNQVDALKSRYRLFVPELPGIAGSELTPGLSMETMATSLHEVWMQERTDDEQLMVLGHSMGGYIVMAWVELYPGELRAFGLIHSSAFADTEEKRETRRKGISVIRSKGSKAFLKTSSPGLFSDETKEQRPGLVSDFMEQFGDFPEETLVAFHEAMIARPDRSNLLKTSGLPVLFVFGEHDTAVKLEDGLKQSPFPEKSYIDVLTHSGHLGMIEEPGRMNEVIADFLAHP